MMIIPVKREALLPAQQQMWDAIVHQFGDYGVESWQGFDETFFTGWWAERQCQYAIIVCHSLRLNRQLFDLFLKFDQGVAEHRAYYARRVAGEQNPPRPLDEVINWVYGFGWMLGFASEEADCDLTVAVNALDFGFDIPALILASGGEARWLPEWEWEE